MKLIKYNYVFIFLLLNSCISIKKYKSLELKNKVLQSHVVQLKNDSIELSKKIIIQKQLLAEKESKNLKPKIKDSGENIILIPERKESKITVSKEIIDNKAKYIYNFAQNIHWKSLTYIDKYRVGVFNNKELKESIEIFFKNKLVSGKKTEVEMISNFNDTKKYQLLIVDKKSETILKKNIKKVNIQPMLIITDDFIYSDCNCISIYEVGGQLKFDTMKSTLKKNGFSLSNSIQNLR